VTCYTLHVQGFNASSGKNHNVECIILSCIQNIISLLLTVYYQFTCYYLTTPPLPCRRCQHLHRWLRHPGRGLGRNSLALTRGISIADVSTIDPLSTNTLSAAAATAGAAAATRDQQKLAAYLRVEPNGYMFFSFSVESYGRLDRPAIELVLKLGVEAAGPCGVLLASFVVGALQELSIGLCRGMFFLYQAVWACLPRLVGQDYGPGWMCPCPRCAACLSLSESVCKALVPRCLE
jgi:hypothetical protein